MKSILLVVLLLSVQSCIANTYYIDNDSGNNANNGLTKATPWKVHPYMKGWAGKYTHTSGDRFIFKGGVVWNSTSFTLDIKAGGTLAQSDLYDSDTTWFVGTSWKAPIFDAEYKKLSNNSVVRISGLANIQIRNLEIKNLLATVNWGPAMVYTEGSQNIKLVRCYLHGWTMPDSIKNDDAHGGIIAVAGAIITVDSCEISNLEYEATHNNGVAIQAAYIVSNTKIHDVSSAILGGTIVHDCIIYDIEYPHDCFDPAYHTNTAYMIYKAKFYNNLVYKFNAGTSIYPEPCWNGSNDTQYYFSNKIIAESYTKAAPLFDIDPEGGTNGVARGVVYICNNTITATNSILMIRVSPRPGLQISKIVIINNDFINPKGASPTCFNTTTTGTVIDTVIRNNIVQSISQASAQGYTLANYYSPVQYNCATVGTGLNLYGQILQDMITFSRPISGPWDVGAYQFSSPTSYIKNETCKINTIKKMPLKVEVINVLGSQVRNNRKSPCGIYFQKIGNQTQKFCRFGLSFPK